VQRVFRRVIWLLAPAVSRSLDFTWFV